MCLLTVFPMPDLMTAETRERLENGASLNPHGSGWAMIEGHRILTGKSLDGDDAVASFLDAYEHATGPAIFHSRWATHGEKNLANTHPFPVARLGQTYVAHNGIMPADAIPAKDDERSDTRKFADDILPKFYKRLDKPTVRSALSTWLGGNKIAVLTVDRRYARNLYVFGQEMGEWVDGVWYSNGDHEGFGRYAKYGSYSSYSPPAKDPCFYCHADAVNVWDVCNVCGSCQDCFEPIRYCQCFTGSSSFVKDTIAEGLDPVATRTDDDEYPVIIGGHPALKAIEAPKPE